MKTLGRAQSSTLNWKLSGWVVPCSVLSQALPLASFVSLAFLFPYLQCEDIELNPFRVTSNLYHFMTLKIVLVKSESTDMFLILIFPMNSLLFQSFFPFFLLSLLPCSLPPSLPFHLHSPSLFPTHSSFLPFVPLYSLLVFILPSLSHIHIP